MMDDKYIYWHLPGFCVYFYLNQVIIHMMKENPGKFREGYRAGSVYGTFPGAIWNGGRAVFGITCHGDMKKIIKTYNDLDVPVRFTWTNSLIEERHLNDTYCNLIMETAYAHKTRSGKSNQVLVNASVLEKYLREHYPDLEFISSTTKRLDSLDDVKEELKKDYFLVVLDYDLNHDEKVLDELMPYAGRIEILADEICFPGCKKRRDHYRDESMAQLNFEKGTVYDCPNKKTRPSFDVCMKRPAFISADEVRTYADKWGYHNFKLVGRGLPQELVLDSYIYYLVREEYRDDMREKIIKQLMKLGVKM